MLRARSDQPEKLVRVSIVADEDASLLEEFGTRVMQQARIARIIEEAYDQDALLDGERVCLLVPLTLTATRERLKGLWEEGCRLPISGMTWKIREALKAPRAVVAMERYLDRRVEANPPPKKTGRTHRCEQEGPQGSQDAPDRAHHS